jgi:hypothetical protein
MSEPSEKIIVRFDSQILNNLEACHRKLKYSSIKGYVPVTKPKPLSRGVLVHDGMKAYYLAIMDNTSRKEAMDAMVNAVRIKQVQSDLPIAESELVVKTLIDYCLYRMEDSWIPLAVEQPFSKILYEDDEIIILQEGIVDLIIADKMIKQATVDHKSSSRNSYVSPMSNQFKGYSSAFGTPHVIVNKIGFQKTLPSSEKFVRNLITYPPSVIEEWEQKVIRRMKRYAMMLNDPIAMDEANETSCDKYGGCIFRGVCEQPPTMRETLLINDFRIRGAWDPFKRDEDDD